MLVARDFREPTLLFGPTALVVSKRKPQRKAAAVNRAIYFMIDNDKSPDHISYKKFAELRGSSSSSVCKCINIRLEISRLGAAQWPQRHIRSEADQ